ncbi:MAG: hypothetical protein EA366_09600 [Spirulina sp. DLM2.Bin59]|nr:MAG: hypothetical protein EA366_09600 [Spirulina sp. DLM2.Bin59]
MSKRTQWFIGLIGLTAALLVSWQWQPSLWQTNPPVYAQTPAASPVPNPEAVPPEPPAPPAPPVATLPLSSVPYTDPGQRFQVGILQGYGPTTVAGVPLFESPQVELPEGRTMPAGAVAYTVALRPRSTDAPLNAGALAQVAIDTFRNGENFAVGAVEPLGDAAQLPWQGTLTSGNRTEPMQGVMIARQIPGRVLILMVAATEAGADQIQPVAQTLAPTLQAMEAEG